MNYIGIVVLFIFSACANHRSAKKIEGIQVAHDSFAKGKVKASALKKIERHEVCFEITIKLSGVKQSQAQPRNWTVAWIDKNNQYHLLSLNQRDPASVPKGGQIMSKYGVRQEWTNTFRTCSPRAEIEDVSGIVLTPKELPFDKRGLRLNWK